MGTKRGLERLIFFTDAVAAIAITLLILPLVDSVPSAASHHFTAKEYFSDHASQVISFLISFAVIAQLWVAHHSIFERIGGYNRRLISLSLFWALTIVILPLPTAITAEVATTPFTIGFYIGTMSLSSLTLTTVAFTVNRNPELAIEGYPITDKMMFGALATSVWFIVAFMLGVFIPGVSYFALLILFLTTPLRILLQRLLSKRLTRNRTEREGPGAVSL